MDNVKKIGLFAFITICLASLVVIGLWVYYEYFDPNITIGVNYVSDQVALDIKPIEDLTPEEIDQYEERWFMEANFYDNSNDNGIVLQELNFNFFTDWTLLENTYRSSGMQLLRDLKPEDIKIGEAMSYNEVQKFKDGNFYYYDTVDGISYDGGLLATQLNREETLIIKIDNRAFSIQLDGYYTFNSYLWFDPFHLAPKTNYVMYGYTNVFADVMQAIRTNSQSYGSYYLKLDLSSYFTIKEYDTETGLFLADDVTDIIKNYAMIKFNYYPQGAVNANQSLFNQIECNSNYGVSETSTDYWQERVIYNLTVDDLKTRTSSTLEGNLVSLTPSEKLMFEEMDRIKINIIINLNDFENIIGLDFNAFENFEIDTLTILSDETTDFYLFEKSLWNSNIKTIAKSTGVNLIINENAINNEYEEVIV